MSEYLLRNVKNEPVAVKLCQSFMEIRCGIYMAAV